MLYLSVMYLCLEFYSWTYLFCQVSMLKIIAFKRKLGSIYRKLGCSIQNCLKDFT